MSDQEASPKESRRVKDSTIRAIGNTGKTQRNLLLDPKLNERLSQVQTQMEAYCLERGYLRYEGSASNIAAAALEIILSEWEREGKRSRLFRQMFPQDAEKEK